MSTVMEPIAHICSDFPDKFGIPRQSGIVDALEAEIVFTPKYRNAHALKGLDGFSHIWLLWNFSEAERSEWSPTVRPPRLGGNETMGVFATRSPFRPNPIGLSCVRLTAILPESPDGPIIRVAGADLMDGTPIYDIKPYIPYTDCHPEAKSGFAGDVQSYTVEVVCADSLLEKLPESKREGLLGLLRQDPRPGYRRNDTRRFGVRYAGFDVRFAVKDGVLTVMDMIPENENREEKHADS